MKRKELKDLCEARERICSYCSLDNCEKCIVAQLINEAFKEVSENEAEDEEINI